MQRTEPDGIVISCDFCGIDWDEVIPMIEGHKGSVLCVSCLTLALPVLEEQEQRQKADGPPIPDALESCSLCLQPVENGTPWWSNSGATPSEGLNPGAVMCRSCARQAARGFHKDPDTEFVWDVLAKTQRLREGAGDDDEEE